MILLTELLEVGSIRKSFWLSVDRARTFARLLIQDLVNVEVRRV